VLRKAARCARQPRFLYGYKPSIQKTGFFKIQNQENGLPKDHRLRADGFIIRAQTMIRTDGFFVRAGLAVHTRVAKSCALRAPTPFFVWIQTIHTKNGVLQNSEPRKRFT
jgi:hypothetical protein